MAVNALVGATLGQERTAVPLLAEQVFGLTALVSGLSFIAAFGLVKAVTNFFAGTLSDRYGRKPVLVAGWLVAIPVPLLLIWAPTWGWVVFANVLLGINQGLTWSTTVIMKIDLVGPARRGLAQKYGLRPTPFCLGIAFIAVGLGLSVFPILFASRGLSIAQIGILAGVYPAVWGVGQLVTGAWSDRIGAQVAYRHRHVGAGRRHRRGRPR